MKNRNTTQFLHRFTLLVYALDYSIEASAYLKAGMFIVSNDTDEELVHLFDTELHTQSMILQRFQSRVWARTVRNEYAWLEWIYDWNNGD